MTDSSKAKIYLADERGIEEEDSFRSYQTFNFGKFFNEHKASFRQLNVLNDETLAGGSSVKMNIQEGSCLILLPVVGAVDYKDSLGNESIINAGEIQIIDLPEGSDFELANPYEHDLVNYLKLSLKKSFTAVGSLPVVVQVDLERNKNSLVEVAVPSEHLFKLSIGQFKGREEAVYELRDHRSGLFVFVVEGAFEVQGRLLHSRDGLGLWDVDGPVDLEALSNEAIVLLLELNFD